MWVEKGEYRKQPINHKGIANPHRSERLGKPDCDCLVEASYVGKHCLDLSITPNVVFPT